MVKREELCRVIRRKVGISRKTSKHPGQLSKIELALIIAHLELAQERLDAAKPRTIQ